MTELPAGKRAGMVVHGEAPLNAESPPGPLAASLLTPADVFYIRNHGPIPEIDPGRWRLQVTGLVRDELQLSLHALHEEFVPVEVTATLQCAGNRRRDLIAVREIPGEAPWGPGATGTAAWTGVRLADVLEHAGVSDATGYVEFLGADHCEEAKPPQPFGASIPIRKALTGDVLLAWEMNGRPLAAAHGAPLRVIVPGYIGARSVKWLQRIVARADPSANFYQAHTYRLLPADADADAGLRGEGVALGAIAVNSDILSPADGALVSAGPLEVIGYAFAGDDRHVARVDISADGGSSWQQAELLDAASPWAWRRWRATVDVAAGEAELVARAWDSAAALQPSDPAQLWNPKGYANNAWARVRVQVRAA